MEKRKAPFSNSEDRISNLPETLIHHILSLLDMKYVVQTCVLSRRWRNLWKSIPILNFRTNLFYSHETEQSEGLVDFVYRVLMLRGNSDIQRLQLVCHNLEWDIETHLCTWMLAAVSRNVQELSIQITDSQTLEFPPCLFTCKSLTKLELKMTGDEYGDITLPNVMGFPRLKSLKLDGLSINDEKLANKLISSCPVLESLIIVDTCVNLNIYSLKLKYFKLEYHYACQVNGEIKTVKLYAPNLTSFSCKDFMSQDYTLENLSSLVTADINMVVEEEDAEIAGRYSEISADDKETYAQRMMKIFSALRNVKVLTLSHRFLEVLSGAPDILESQPPQFRNLRCLKLETWLSTDCLPAITYLLKISPNIESLFLKITEKLFNKEPVQPSSDEIKFNLESIGDYWEVLLSLPCMLHHLKYVDIQGVQGCVIELKFLESLLKNAMVLERVVLSSSSYRNYFVSQHTEERLKKFSDKLLKLPRASASIGIFFKF